MRQFSDSFLVSLPQTSRLAESTRVPLVLLSPCSFSLKEYFYLSHPASNGKSVPHPPHASRASTKGKKRKWPSTVRSASRASGARPERPLGGAGWVSHPPSLGKGERDRKSAGRGGASEMRKRLPSPFAADAVVPPPPPSPPPFSPFFFFLDQSPTLSFCSPPPPSLLLTESKPLLPLRLDPGQRRRRRGGKRGERGDDGLL